MGRFTGPPALLAAALGLVAAGAAVFGLVHSARALRGGGDPARVTFADMLATGQAAPGAAAAGTIDPDAIDALKRMGEYLRSLKAFQLKADVTAEDVLQDGQKVQSTTAVDLLAEPPAHLRADLVGDRRERLFLFDGKTFTLWAPSARYYAVVPAPGTIAKLADELEAKYDIELPLVDLFRWGTPESDIADIQSATDLGPSQVEGVTCEHYAFRQQGLDWQVWIQNGDYPLPRKLVLTTLTDEARPQHTSVYTWNLAPSYNDAAFAFTPPADARKIGIAEVTAGGVLRTQEVQR